MDHTMPIIPEDVLLLALEDVDLMYDQRCAELWDEICTEVLDEKYTSRSHHNSGTYNLGCRGPLCRKANREHPRRKNVIVTPLQAREDRIFDPVLEYFHLILRNRIKVERQKILTETKEGLI